MQLACAAIVIETVCDIGILLYLCQGDACANGMYRSSGDVPGFARDGGHPAKFVHYAAVLAGAAKLFRGEIGFQAHSQFGIGLGFENVPHLGFASAAGLQFGGLGVIGVDLDGEVFRREEELDEEGALGLGEPDLADLFG